MHRTFDERRYDQFRVLFEGREETALARQATEVFHLAFRRICQKLGEYPTATGRELYQVALRNRAANGPGRTYEVAAAVPSV